MGNKKLTDKERKEREAIWNTAIGLQKVDGLRVSDYLVELANKHINGEITLEEVQALINEYWAEKAAKKLAHRAVVLEAENARLSGEPTYIVEEVRSHLKEKFELNEDEMLEEIDKVLRGESSDRFTEEQASKIRERLSKYPVIEADHE